MGSPPLECWWIEQRMNCLLRPKYDAELVRAEYEGFNEFQATYLGTFHFLPKRVLSSYDYN
jgi:hypothetical protein